MDNFFSRTSWIKNRLRENNMNTTPVYEMYDRFCKETNSTWMLDSYKRKVRSCLVDISEVDDKMDETEELLKLEAQKQRLTDLNNQVRKSNRESYRLYNSLEEIFAEYVDVLSSVDMTKFKIKEHATDKKNRLGILQLSDLHMNEIIYESESLGNSFDFNIASCRLKKLITESTSLFKFYNIKDVYIFMTGDLINSTRRLSEKLAQNSSLVRASLLTTFLIQQAIIELTKNFNVTVASVVGNESRLDEFMDSSDLLASENWDYLIYNNLRLLFSGTKVSFIDSANNIQSVVRLKNGYNALLLHGHTFKSGSIEKQVGSLLQSYLFRGIQIHGIYYGHFHNASIGGNLFRSSSLCGANSYSAVDLMYVSRASQNMYIVNPDLSINGMNIDLQNYPKEGYDINEELERYNVKTVMNNKVTIENLV